MADNKNTAVISSTSNSSTLNTLNTLLVVQPIAIPQPASAVVPTPVPMSVPTPICTVVPAPVPAPALQMPKLRFYYLNLNSYKIGSNLIMTFYDKNIRYNAFKPRLFRIKFNIMDINWDTKIIVLCPIKKHRKTVNGVIFRSESLDLPNKVNVPFTEYSGYTTKNTIAFEFYKSKMEYLNRHLYSPLQIKMV